ncbi:MAG: hypothetical protein KDJ73_05900 [Notoacmeibacter sp.]|nr:hypothetical protein [Notoacmeibacter sp.]MCC0031783.1 hypothetical protein [Brucellaceae bacterium]
MDPVTTLFYASICGVLAAVSPNFGARYARFLAGVVVGAVSAMILPVLRVALGL